MGQGAAYGKAYRTDGPSYIGYKKDLIFVHVYIEVNPGIKANLGFIIVSWSFVANIEGSQKPCLAFLHGFVLHIRVGT